MPPSILNIRFSGGQGAVFWLALKTSFLTVLTLGIYRFWAKTRLRRYYWSAIRPGGAPLEYVGDPLEKLLGFLVAVVFMAFYIGIVNLLLMYFSFAVFQDNFAAYLLSFLGLVPLIFFAQYRARRYILARTRWRGIRFGLEPGAWGYSWRSIVHWIVAILSLGILWPLTTLWLEKYRISRTYYGDLQFVQAGRRGLLFGAMKHVYYAGGLTAVVGAMAYFADNPLWLVFLVLTIPWTVYGLAYWRAESFKRMAEAKSLGDIRFKAAPRPMRIVGIYALGGFIMNIAFSGVMMVALFCFAIVMGTMDIESIELEDLDRLVLAAGPAIVFVYVMAVVLYRALAQSLISLPIAKHFAETTTLVETQNLPMIVQRERDEFAEAEGFAEALDVGAAI